MGVKGVYDETYLESSQSDVELVQLVEHTEVDITTARVLEERAAVDNIVNLFVESAYRQISQ